MKFLTRWLAALDWKFGRRRWKLTNRRLYAPFVFGPLRETYHGLDLRTFTEARCVLFGGRTTHMAEETWEHPSGEVRFVARGRKVWEATDGS